MSDAYIRAQIEQLLVVFSRLQDNVDRLEAAIGELKVMAEYRQYAAKLHEDLKKSDIKYIYPGDGLEATVDDHPFERDNMIDTSDAHLDEVEKPSVEHWQTEDVKPERNAAQTALDNCGMGGIYDVFDSPADAINQMAGYIKELEDKRENKEWEPGQAEDVPLFHWHGDVKCNCKMSFTDPASDKTEDVKRDEGEGIA